MGFSEILDAVIPWVIFIVFGYLLYRPLKEPLDKLFRAIWSGVRFFIGWITGTNNDIETNDPSTKTIEWVD